jgi:hypothetical protein
VRLGDGALKQQTYRGDDSFIQRTQALLEHERIRVAEVPSHQRPTRPDSIQAYLTAYERNEAMVRACREGAHTLSAIVREVGLSVSRVSRIIAAYEWRWAKGKTLPWMSSSPGWQQTGYLPFVFFRISAIFSRHSFSSSSSISS